ncbi:MAG: Scr1 family TA system antitoxin-like transcriptional regulator [Pseudonocardiaceae bacterium]
MTDAQPDRPSAETLGGTLRRLRTAAGVTGVEMAHRVGRDISQSTISRLERGELAVTMMWAGRYGFHLDLPHAERRELIEAAQTAMEARAEIVPIRTILQAGGVESVQRRIRLRERNVSQLDVFHNTIVPGLVQTEAYMRAVVAHRTPAQIERFVAERLHRQREAATRSCTILLTEGVFFQGMPDPAMLAEQAEHIADLATSHRFWRVGVVPRITARPNITHNGFDVYDDGQAFIGTTAGNALMKEPRPVTDHVARFADLVELAVLGEDAAVVLRRIAADYRR